MRHKKSDFQIVFEDYNKFSIRVRKPFFWLFYRWIPLMYQETENTDETLLTFEKFEDASNFIDKISY